MLRNRLQKYQQLSILACAVLFSAIPWQAHLHYILPDRVQNSLSIFFGIVIEALPFVLLGVLVSAGMRRYLTGDRLNSILPKSPWLAFPMSALIGLLFPVCECGNLPVARRLIRQGMPPAQALTFFLAAPILNPAVIISTFAAFRFDLPLVAGRIIGGFVIAILVGGYFSLLGRTHILSNITDNDESCEHDHSLNSINSLADELFEMLAALAIGAGVAAVIQVAVPRTALLALGTTPVTAILVMMVLAVVVSLCSTVDAFFALSFASTFSAASLLAFLILGPMIDFRTVALARRAFNGKAIAEMAVLVIELVFIFALAAHHFQLL